MKKYKLLKDLPLAKAGTIVRLEDISIQSSIKLIFKVNNTEHPLCAIYKKEINEWLEEIKEKPSVWELGQYDDFYYIQNNYLHKTNVNNFPFGFFEGDAFLTKEEAQKELEKRKAIQRIKKFCWENGIEFADKEFILNSYNKKYEIGYSFYERSFDTNFFSEYSTNSFFIFRNEYNAQKVIDNCEEDLKIIFDV